MTAQAFSHFTYALSREEILICDIQVLAHLRSDRAYIVPTCQGVGGMYTDPQIHTISGKGFGAGNLGQTGIRAFLLRHQCNEVVDVINHFRTKSTEDILANSSLHSCPSNAHHLSGTLTSHSRWPHVRSVRTSAFRYARAAHSHTQSPGRAPGGLTRDFRHQGIASRLFFVRFPPVILGY